MESSDRSDRAYDEWEAGIAGRARDRLARSPDSELGRFTSSFHRGVLRLRGCVRSQYLKQIAQELVSRIEGVDAIVNHIEVRMAADRGPSVAGVLGPGPDHGPVPTDRWRDEAPRGG
jgi:osmotically-inducible protein OsmY